MPARTQRHPGRAAACRAARFRRRAGGRAADRRRLLRHLAGAAGGSGRSASSGRWRSCRVKADWRAPVERSGYEAAWMRIAGAASCRLRCPSCSYEDRGRGCGGHGLSRARPAPAVEGPCCARARPTPTDGGRRSATAWAGSTPRPRRRPDIAAQFPTDAIFHDIRLEPYLLATAAAPSRPGRRRCAGSRGARPRPSSPWSMATSARRTSCSAPTGPVFLDAECAWYGDPAFDLAFCLNHLLLKCLWTPAAAPGFLACFDALAASYLEHVDWEPRGELEARAAACCPACSSPGSTASRRSST